MNPPSPPPPGADTLFRVDLNLSMVVAPDEVAPTVFASDTPAWVLRLWEVA